MLVVYKRLVITFCIVFCKSDNYEFWVCRQIHGDTNTYNGINKIDLLKNY